MHKAVALPQQQEENILDSTMFCINQPLGYLLFPSGRTFTALIMVAPCCPSSASILSDLDPPQLGFHVPAMVQTQVDKGRSTSRGRDVSTSGRQVSLTR
jgi:hypothetical protein